MHHQGSMDWPAGLNEVGVNEAGAAVVEGCNAPYDKGKPENLRAMFRGDRCVGAWDVSAHEVTSDVDEDGIVRPKKGEGRVGRGSPMVVTHNGSLRPMTDGCGLCSPCRWLPQHRHVDSIAIKMRRALQELLVNKFGDLGNVASPWLAESSRPPLSLKISRRD